MMEIVIKISDKDYKSMAKGYLPLGAIVDAIRNGKQLPEHHGRLVDVGKIDEDMIEQDNPIIYLTVNGEYIEAISLDYINDLPTIIEADKEGEK